MEGEFGPDLAAVISVLQTEITVVITLTEELRNYGNRCVIPEIGFA